MRLGEELEGRDKKQKMQVEVAGEDHWWRSVCTVEVPMMHRLGGILIRGLCIIAVFAKLLANFISVHRVPNVVCMLDWEPIPHDLGP